MGAGGEAARKILPDRSAQMLRARKTQDPGAPGAGARGSADASYPVGPPSDSPAPFAGAGPSFSRKNAIVRSHDSFAAAAS